MTPERLTEIHEHIRLNYELWRDPIIIELYQSVDRLTRQNRELRDVLRELNERLRAAWNARQLPADVIPGSLVTRCNKALG